MKIKIDAKIINIIFVILELFIYIVAGGGGG